MATRIISVYCFRDDGGYYYDLDSRIKDFGDFIQSMHFKKSGFMRCKEGDYTLIVCRYKNGKNTINEIRYKGEILEIDCEQENIMDKYEHGFSNPERSMRIEIIEKYEPGNFPLEQLREKNLISNHKQIHGDIASDELTRYIEKNKRIYKHV